MTAMQESHQRTRDEYERILKQLKQENELLNGQVKQHLTDKPSLIFFFPSFYSDSILDRFRILRSNPIMNQLPHLNRKYVYTNI